MNVDVLRVDLGLAQLARSAGGRFRMKPPFEPVGTMTAFFTICAFISPRTSVRKSSQPVRPADAAARHAPPRRWMPSISGE